MGIHIVIDGYNLIRQSPQFRDVDRQDMQAGREALVEALVAYKRVKGHPITVVFDGGAAGLGMPRRDTLKGINVRFSRSGELADAVIKRMARREKEKMLVVTSDNDIVHYVQSQGAATMGALEFDERLLLVHHLRSKGADESEETLQWQATTKKKGPSRRLPRQLRKQQRKLSKL
jgi:uncharacterized protein